MEKETILAYNITVDTYTIGGYVNVEKNCNGLTFTNTGDDTVRVNDMILYPGVPGTLLGDSRSIGGNKGEIFKGLIRVAFANVGAAPALEVVQKFYVGPNDLYADHKQ